MSTGQETTPASERRGPPMPRFLFKVMNPLLKAVLASPLHGRFSRELMLITFTGRKTGKRYTTPVGYTRQDQRVFVFSHSPWHKNFIQPSPVTLRIRGKNLAGTGSLVRDPEKIREMVLAMMAAGANEERARAMGFFLEDPQAPPDKVLEATQGTHFIEIILAEDLKNDQRT